VKTTVVNIRGNDFDVYIGRGSPYGNPFRIGDHGTRSDVIRLYRAHFLSDEGLMKMARENLRGKVLGCYCKPKTCHGDVIADYLNNLRDEDV